MRRDQPSPNEITFDKDHAPSIRKWMTEEGDDLPA
jgi:hypothetical protein